MTYQQDIDTVRSFLYNAEKCDDPDLALDALDRLTARLDRVEKDLKGIERFATDALDDGHPEMVVVQGRATAALARLRGTR